MLLAGRQVQGGSFHQRPVGQKLLRIDEIGSAQLAPIPPPMPRQFYKRGDPAMQTIYAQL